jgi:NAD(P) transhydrogenase subunit alpha
MIVGVPRESFPGERRVALAPAAIPSLAKAGLEVVVETDAGIEAGYLDADCLAKGARVLPQRAEVFGAADIITQVLCYGSNDRNGKADLSLFHRDQVLVGFLRPLGSVATIQDIADKGITAFSVELMPRTTRAQGMDALSAMATVAGYKAVLVAADALPKLFPMLTTAAGTITPARVLILGVGVAGLQAIATARRLGAAVSAYDLRPAVKEQVQSLGARFVELAIEAKDAQDAWLCHRARRNLLSPAARVTRKGDRGTRCSNHHRGDPREKNSHARDQGNGDGNGARLGDCRSRSGTRRKLRTDTCGRESRRARGDDYRMD